MQVLTRFIAIVLILTLGGGAQACVASCAVPPPASSKPSKPACHRCEKPREKAPATPCPRCRVASQDRAPADANPAQIAAPDLATDGPRCIGVGESFEVLTPTPRLSMHGPPSDLFHQFCLLLI